MALNRFKWQAGIHDGEKYAAAGTTYIGGQPCAYNSSGDLVLCTSGNVAAYCGVFTNNNTVDGVTATTRAQASKFSGHNNLTIERELVSEVQTYPFDENQTYSPGDPLYINNDGKWTNQVVSGQNSFGVVEAVTGSGPSTALQILLYR